MNQFVVEIIAFGFIGIAIYSGIICLMNTYDAIVNYKKPELFCAKCGKKVSKKTDKCPKCKVKLK